MPLLDEAVRQQLSQHPFALQQPGVPTPTSTPSASFRPSPFASTLMILGALLPMMAGKFGGSKIPPEWIEENEAFRAGAGKEHKWATDIYKPGTRVSMRPWGQRTGEPTSIYAQGKLSPPTYGDMAGGTGVVVTPGTPEAGEPAYTPSTEATRRQPTPEHVAVRGDQSGHWFWRHRDSLEVLPPKEPFPLGSQATYKVGGYMARGMVSEPPHNAPPRPGNDWVWMDIDGDYWPPLGEEVTHYRNSNTWGSWFHMDDLEKEPRRVGTLREPPKKK